MSVSSKMSPADQLKLIESLGIDGPTAQLLQNTLAGALDNSSSKGFTDTVSRAIYEKRAEQAAKQYDHAMAYTKVGTERKRALSQREEDKIIKDLAVALTNVAKELQSNTKIVEAVIKASQELNASITDQIKANDIAAENLHKYNILQREQIQYYTDLEKSQKASGDTKGAKATRKLRDATSTEYEASLEAESSARKTGNIKRSALVRGTEIKTPEDFLKHLNAYTEEKGKILDEYKVELGQLKPNSEGYNEKVGILSQARDNKLQRAAAEHGLNLDVFGSAEDKAGNTFVEKLGSQLNSGAGGMLGDLLGVDGGEDLGAGGVITNAIETAIPGVGTIVKVLGTISKVVSVLSSLVDEGVNKALSIAGQYMAGIESHLAGLESGLTFTGEGGIADWLMSTFSTSAYVNQEDLIKNIYQLSEKGITYNLEERALIATIKDRMVDSFEVLNDSLNRMIRLQQADTTSQELGVEAQLTELFNGLFSDSSYLATHVDDSIYSTLEDALSQFNYSDSIDYEYAVQKWLGSLYSVGMSQEAVSKIATGLNYLTTGNVSGLTEDSSLTTLFGMATKRAGLSLAEVLTEGLNSSSINAIMQSMVEYLQSIAENTENQVTKSAWSGITGLSLSDYRAVSNLTSSDIAAISSSFMDYESASSKFSEEIENVVTRTTVGQMADTMKNNLLLTIGNEFLGSDEDSQTGGIVRYVTWKASDFLESLGGVAGAVGTFTKAIDMLTFLPDFLSDIVNSFGNTLNMDYVDALLAVDSVTSRGSAYNSITGVSAASSAADLTGGTSTSNSTTSNVSTGVSLSVGYTTNDGNITMVSASTGDTSYGSFSSNASTVTSQTVSSATSSDISVTTLYDALFVSQQNPIRVKVASYEKDAIIDLRIADIISAIFDAAATHNAAYSTPSTTTFYTGMTDKVRG